MLLTDGVKAIRKGEMKPSEWGKCCIDVIEKIDLALNAWGYFDADLAYTSAKSLDDTNWSKLRPSPMLAGAPLGIKDIFNTRDMPNSMGSAIRSNYFPGNDARVVEWAKLLGAFVIGKTKTAEFAVHHPPNTLNPYSRDIIAGTSSTGSAVAVATGMVPAALATQSGGSISRPASYNGVVGYKPTFGLIPRTGVLKTCDTLDTIGWMTRSVADAELLFDSLRVKGDNYPMAERGIARAKSRTVKRKRWKVAFAKAPGWEYAKDYMKDETNRLYKLLEERSDVDIIEIDLYQKLRNIHEVHKIIYYKNLSYYFYRELTSLDGVSELFKEINEIGSLISPEQYFKALSEQEDLVREFNLILEDFDIVISPSVAGEAVAWGELEPKDSSLLWTTVGVPTITLPLGYGPNGFPIGMTLLSSKYADYTLLDFAKTVMPEAVKPIMPKFFNAASN